MKPTRRVFAFGLTGLTLAPSAYGQSLRRPRIRCLSVGNDYDNAPIRYLSRARRDGELIAERFHQLPNSVVQHVSNASAAEIRAAIGKLRDGWREEDFFVFYYAGHGVQLSDREEGNAIISIETLDGGGTALDLLSIAEIVEEFRSGSDMEEAPLLVMLDACRDNPFATDTSARSSFARLDRIDQIAGGLALPNIRGRNLLFCYSTDPGEVASDTCPNETEPRSWLFRELRCSVRRGNPNGPFAAMLSHHLLSQVSVSAMLTATRRDVHELMGQTPWIFSSMTREHYLAGYPLLPPG